MLSVRAVHYRYPGGVVAVSGIDLEVGAGQLCAVVGANGSGKSTLLRLAAAALEPDAGRVELFGRSFDSPRRVASRVAWISQDTALDPDMTGAEHLHLQTALMGLARGVANQRIAKLVAGLRLEDAVARFVSSYSGGMRRRLHLALGLVHEPELLLLDEPTAGLDPEGQATVWTFLVERAALGCGLVVITHDLERVLAHASRVLFLDQGSVAASGTPAELAEAHGGDLLTAYSALTGRDPRALAGRPGGPGSGRGRRGAARGQGGRARD